MEKSKIPFNFIFDYLVPLDIKVKPMFGMYSIYLEDKILLILRQKKEHSDSNGVWVATHKEHHESLRKELQSLHSIPAYTKGISETEWQLIPAADENFESAVIKTCELIKQHDIRIGRIPKPKRPKKQH